MGVWSGSLSAVAAAGIAVSAQACGAAQRSAPVGGDRAGEQVGDQVGDQIVLYRDRAVILQRVVLDAPRGGVTRIALRLPAGVEPGDAMILDRGGLAAVALQVAGAAGASSDAAAGDPPAPRAAIADPPAPRAAVAHLDGEETAEDPDDIDGDAAPPPAAHATPSDAELEARAPRAGRFAVTLGYATDRLAWQAAYTITTTAARDRAVARGAIAIRNTTGIAFHARTRVVDTELGAWRDLSPDQLHTALGGGPAPTSTPAPVPAPHESESREIGTLTLADGETRVELLAPGAPRPLRSVLVYDPIGPGLDHTGAIPIYDPAIGVEPPATGRVSESFEIDRDPRTSRGLPAGPVRLLERHPDGSLELLGESHLFGPATRAADVDTVPVGTAQGVVGHRVRRDFGKDDDQRRFSEEFLVTIDNARPRPVELVLREHLYRGQNWTLAYQSVAAVKEGPQQIALRTSVPANGRAKVLYVVVYTW